MLGSIAIDGTRARLLAPFLVVALLFCHGFFGVLHELSGPFSSGADVAASAAHGMADHGAADAGSGPSGHFGASDYAAVLTLFLLWGAILSFGRLARSVRLPLADPRPAGTLRRPRPSPVLARGTDPPFSQVFRL